MTARERRMLMAALGCIAAALLAARVGPAAAGSYRGLRDGAVEWSSIARTQEQLVHESEAWRDSLDLSVGRLLAAARRLLAGRTPAEAFAMLSDAISAAAQAHGAHIARLEDAGGDSVRSMLVPVSASAQVNGDVVAIASFLDDLESSRLLLTIDALSVRVPHAGASVGWQAALEIEITVTGWRVQEETPR